MEEKSFLYNANFEWDSNKVKENAEKHGFKFSLLKQFLIDNYESSVQFKADRGEDSRISLFILEKKSKKAWNVILKVIDSGDWDPITFRVISVHRKNSGANYQTSKQIWWVKGYI